MPYSQSQVGLLLPGVPRLGALPTEGEDIAAQWQARGQAAQESEVAMSLYRRGGVWWYEFRFNGQRIQESAKTNSKTVARDAERARRRELEQAYNRIPKRERMPLF